MTVKLESFDWDYPRFIEALKSYRTAHQDTPSFAVNFMLWLDKKPGGLYPGDKSGQQFIRELMEHSDTEWAHRMLQEKVSVFLFLMAHKKVPWVGEDIPELDSGPAIKQYKQNTNIGRAGKTAVITSAALLATAMSAGAAAEASSSFKERLVGQANALVDKAEPIIGEATVTRQSLEDAIAAAIFNSFMAGLAGAGVWAASHIRKDKLDKAVIAEITTNLLPKIDAYADRYFQLIREESPKRG